MKLGCLPTSRDNIRIRAEREGWPHEEAKGLGDKRRVYQVPEYVLEAIRQRTGAPPQKPTKDTDTPRDAGGVVPHPRAANMELMETVIEGVERWLAKQGVTLSPDKKATVCSLLYRYFEQEESFDTEDLERVLSKIA